MEELEKNLETCIQCEEIYDMNVSFADENDMFCSITCEKDYKNRKQIRETNRR